MLSRFVIRQMTGINVWYDESRANFSQIQTSFMDIEYSFAMNKNNKSNRNKFSL